MLILVTRTYKGHNISGCTVGPALIKNVLKKNIFDHVTGSSKIKLEKWLLTKQVVWNSLDFLKYRLDHL